MQRFVRRRANVSAKEMCNFTFLRSLCISSLCHYNSTAHLSWHSCGCCGYVRFLLPSSHHHNAFDQLPKALIRWLPVQGCHAPANRPGTVLDMGSAASTQLAGASTDELKEVASGISENGRSKILAAIISLEKPAASAASMEEIAGRYSAHASDGDWGSYGIHVSINKDATAKIVESSCNFRDSPEDVTTMEGACTLEGDILSFTSCKVTQEQDGTGSKAPSTSEKVETIKFKVQSDGKLARLNKDGAVAEIQGGYGGDPKPAILSRK